MNQSVAGYGMLFTAIAMWTADRPTAIMLLVCTWFYMRELEKE